jgi:hypothetical protein
MVNRVHPETGRAWSRWQDQPKIQQALRELERELGVREVPGRLWQHPEQEPPERPATTFGERARAERTGAPPLVERARALAPAIRDAVSWRDLDERLAAAGLRLERRGPGLVVTDGAEVVKASRLGRDLSLRGLEARFGVAYADRDRAPDLPPEVARIARDLRVYERVEALHRAGYAVEVEASAAAARRDQLAQAVERAERAQRAAERGMAAVYRDPTTATAAFRRAAEQEGLPAAAERLRTQPEAFGALQTVEQRRFGGPGGGPAPRAPRGGPPATAGLWGDVARAEAGVFDAAQASRTRRLEDALMRELAQVYRDPRAARAQWERAAQEQGGERAAAALARDPEQFGALRSEGGRLTGGRLPNDVRVHAGRAGDAATVYVAAREAQATGREEHTAARDDAARAAVRARVARRSLVEAGVPALAHMSRQLGAAVRDLAPVEVRQLHLVLTAPQVALATKLRDAVRDITLGRDDPGR